MPYFVVQGSIARRACRTSRARRPRRSRSRKPTSQALERHVIGNGVVRNQNVSPRLPTMLTRVLTGVLAPLHRHVPLRQDRLIAHLILRLGLKHVDAVACLCNKVRLVLQMIRARLVVELELPLGWLEPLDRFTLQDDGQLSLRIRLELLNRGQTTTESPEQIARQIGRASC